jgi:hypothetical protein
VCAPQPAQDVSSDTRQRTQVAPTASLKPDPRRASPLLAAHNAFVDEEGDHCLNVRARMRLNRNDGLAKISAGRLGVVVLHAAPNDLCVVQGLALRLGD